MNLSKNNNLKEAMENMAYLLCRFTEVHILVNCHYLWVILKERSAMSPTILNMEYIDYKCFFNAYGT